jgi:hypothetical protein
MSGHFDALLGILSQEAVDSLERASTVSDQTAVGAYYVGKHGSDSFDGKSNAQAFLTFGAATAVASSGDVIICLDSGTYNESVSLPSGVNLFAPAATIITPGGGGSGVGCVETNGGSPYVRVGRLTPGTGETGVLQNDYAGTSNIDVDIIDARTSGASAILNLASVNAGVMMIRVRQIYVGASGYGVGSATQDSGHIHLDVGDIYLEGDNATALILITNTKIVGRIDHILEQGTRTGTVGIDVNAGTVSINVSDITADTVYDVAFGATINMFANELTGSVGGGTGTANVTTP